MEIHNEILKFAQTLPLWHQILAMQALDTISEEYTEEEALDFALDRFLFENKLAEEGPIVFDVKLPQPSESIDNQEKEDLCLVNVSEVTNVNALSQCENFEISKLGITVVYGENGSGKSGYGRLFNDSFHTRARTKILGNVYSGNKELNYSAKFTFKPLGGAKYTIEFPEGASDFAFKGFASFDTSAVSVHLDEQNQLHALPVDFIFFEKLSRLTEKLAINLDAKLTKVSRDNKFLEKFEGQSVIKQLIEGLSQDTDIEKIKNRAKFSDEEGLELAELPEKIIGLDPSKIDSKKKKLNRVFEALTKVSEKNLKFEMFFEKQKVLSFKKVIDDRNSLQKTISKSSIEKFKDDNFFNIGSETWKNFISLGVELIDKENEVRSYPRSSDPCPFCKQGLTEQAIKLIESYDEFIKDEAGRKLNTAINDSRVLLKEVRSLDVNELKETDELYQWLKEHEESLPELLNIYLNEVKKNRGIIKSSLENWSWVEIGSKLSNPLDIDNLKEKINENILACDTTEITKQQNILKERKTYLEHLKKLTSNVDDIINYVEDLKWIEKARSSKGTIRTSNISKKSKDLYKKYISEDYKQIFKEECIKLGAPQPDLTEKSTKGKAQRQYRVAGLAPSLVLSEGEQRAVALADFFTEAKVSNLSGLILDDPINSMDHTRREKIAKRLVVEARDRQIIILTHDLLFLNDLMNESSERDVTLKCHWMEKHGTNEAGVIHLDCAPDISSSLVNPSIPQEYLKKAREIKNPQDRIRVIKEGFSALRLTYEAFVFKKIFNGAVSPFDRRIKYSQFEKMHISDELILFVSSKLRELSGDISAHLSLDREATNKSCEKLENEISIYNKKLEEFSVEKKSLH